MVPRDRNSLTPDSEDQRFIRRLVFIAAVVALAVLLWKIADLLLLAFGAMLGSILLSTVANWLDDHTILPRAAGLAIAALALLAVLAAIGLLFTVETTAQAGHLIQVLPADWARIQSQLSANPIGRKLVTSLDQYGGGGRVAALAAALGLDAGKVLVNFIIILIGAVFFAADPALYRRGLLLLVPPRRREVARQSVEDVRIALKLWLLTQLLSMVMMGAMIAFGLWCSGLEVWGSLGVLGGLSEFIPYVGPTLAMIPALVVSLAGGGSIVRVLITYAGVRLVQANVITPLISQRVVAVPAGVYLFAIIGMGFAFGIFGMFFAGALTVAGFTLVRRVYLAELLGEAIPRPGE